MEKEKLTDNVIGSLPVLAQDIARLARIAHEMRQEISDPRLPIHARTKYANTIEAIDSMIQHAGTYRRNRSCGI